MTSVSRAIGKVLHSAQENCMFIVAQMKKITNGKCAKDTKNAYYTEATKFLSEQKDQDSKLQFYHILLPKFAHLKDDDVHSDMIDLPKERLHRAFSEARDESLGLKRPAGPYKKSLP